MPTGRSPLDATSRELAQDGGLADAEVARDVAGAVTLPVLVLDLLPLPLVQT